MNLREPGDDLLGSLGVPVQVDRRVLLLQAAQRGEHLVLIALALGFDSERHHWSRELDLRHLHRLVARGQPIAGSGLLELGHRPDVSRAELVFRPRVRALERHQRPHPLLAVATGVQHLRILLDHALVDPEEVDATGERVGAGLEHVCEQLRVLDRLECHFADLEPTVLDRRGQVLDDRVEQPVDPHVLRGHAAGDGEHLAVIRAVLERGDDLLVRDLLPLEVALHQGVGRFRDLVHQLLAVLLGLVGQVVGDRDLGAVLAP